MSLVVLNSDLLCLIASQLTMNSLTNLLRANKSLFEQRKVYISSNLIFQEFSLFAKDSYFNVLYNSHMKDAFCPEICMELPANATNTSNTFTLLSFAVKHNETVSSACCALVLESYLQQLLAAKYGVSMYANAKNAFMKSVLKYTWWQCKINFFDVYEILYLTKKKKYRAVEKCLSQVHFGNTESFTSFTISLQIIMDWVMMQNDGKTRAVMAYLLYAYLHEAFHLVVGMKHTFIDMVKFKCDEFIYCIRNNMSTLPKYLKTFIIEKIQQVHVNLLQI